MKITIAAIGKLSASQPETLWVADYQKRLPWKVVIKEGDAKKGLKGTALQQVETDLLLGWCPPKAYKIALDERGKAMDSVAFSAKLQQLQEQGVSELCFLIGGADGHTEQLRQESDMLLSFGHMVWPHKMVRVMLMEQLYRAYTIAIGHPCHRM